MAKFTPTLTVTTTKTITVTKTYVFVNKNGDECATGTEDAVYERLSEQMETWKDSDDVAALPKCWIADDEDEDVEIETEFELNLDEYDGG